MTNTCCNITPAHLSICQLIWLVTLCILLPRIKEVVFRNLQIRIKPICTFCRHLYSLRIILPNLVTRGFGNSAVHEDLEVFRSDICPVSVRLIKLKQMSGWSKRELKDIHPGLRLDCQKNTCSWRAANQYGQFNIDTLLWNVSKVFPESSMRRQKKDWPILKWFNLNFKTLSGLKMG